MRIRKNFILFVSIVITISCLHLVLAQEKKVFKYVGAKKCSACHKTAQRGDQYGQWQGTLHANAFATLGTDVSKKVAAKAGIKGDPQTAQECLICHTTGYEAPAEEKEAALTLEEGVSCEACHGPGSEYRSLVVKNGIKAGNITRESVGMRTPDAALCQKCHNEKSPTFKGFNYGAMLSNVLHPVPVSQ